MTDLERVREALLDRKRMTEAWLPEFTDEALTDLDAHLKEDAEREDRLMDAYTAMDERDAELARLREERDKLHALYNRAQDDASREAEIRVNQGFELARLRSDLDGYMKAAHDYEAELTELIEETARLQELVADGLVVKMNLEAELAKLREVADFWEREGQKAVKKAASLREERDKLHALYNRAQDDASREAEIRVNQGFELARLRRENEDLRMDVADLEGRLFVATEDNRMLRGTLEDRGYFGR